MSKREYSDSEYKTLGLIFIMLGVSMTISLGLVLNPVFITTGLPFIGVGIYFLIAKTEDAE